MKENLEKILSGLPAISQDRETAEIGEKILGFKAMLKAKRDQLFECRTGGDLGSISTEVIDKDSEFLISGGGIDNLAGLPSENVRLDIRRQIFAIKKTIKHLESKREQRVVEVLKKRAAGLPAEVENVFYDMLQAGQIFEQKTKEAIELDDRLSAIGIKAIYRPERLKVGPYFRRLVIGDIGRATLKWMIHSKMELFVKEKK